MKKFLFVLPAFDKNYKSLFSEYDVKSLDITYAFLCSEPKEKILKKDIDLDFNTFSQYDIICPVGAEAFKYICGMTGVTNHNGRVIENKYVPIINPNLTVFKPQYKSQITEAVSTLHKIAADKLDVSINQKDYRYVDTVVEFEPFLSELEKADTIVVDIETTAFSPRKGNVIGVAFSTKPHQGIFVSSEVVKLFVDRLQNVFDSKFVIFHNAKFDIQFLGYEYGFKFPKFDDTILMHYCLEESVGTHGLKALALRFTDLGDYERELDNYKKEWCRKAKIKLEEFNYGMLPIDILAPYACRDADATFQLWLKFKPIIEANKKLSNVYYQLLIPFTRALMKLEGNGGPINVDKLVSLIEDYTIDIEECIEEINMHPAVERFKRLTERDSFNPNSTQQLRELFFDILRIPPVKETKSGAYSTDKEVLSEIDHPLAACILDLRGKTKMRNTYLEAILSNVDMDQRLRSSFNIVGTTSGRLSSSGALNYQNIPRDNKDIKKTWRAREGYKIVQGDLKTAEVYYAAVLSDDAFLQQAFIDNVDFHSYIAKNIFNLPCPIDKVKNLFPDHRQWAKAITFGIMYQAGPSKIAETANVTYNEAKQFINRYFAEARQLKKFIENSNSFIENNYYIYSFFGRKRRLSEARSPNRAVAGHAVRSGVNFLVQSVASDINLLGLVDAMEWIETNKLSEEIIPFTVVHDSIVAEVHDDYVDLWVTNMRRCIQKDRGLTIPNCPIGVDFEIGPSWGELASYKV